MTAEIAVMNKRAVALAADSAVTIGYQQKTYNSANKLFMLSKYEPVGAMIFGGAEFLDVPWETILKQYRETIGDRYFESLNEQAEHFLDFLRTNDRLFSDSRKKDFLRSLAGSYASKIRNDFISLVEDRFKNHQNSEGLPEDAFVQLLDEAIAAEESRLDRISDLDGRGVLPVFDEYHAEIASFVQASFEDYPITANQIEQLSSVFWKWLRKNDWGPGSSGIVIAGFGRSDVFPCLRAYYLELVCADWLKVRPDQQIDVAESGSTIIPFAQSEMVEAFLTGADPNYQKVAEGQLDTIFQRLPETLVNGLTSTQNLEEDIRQEVIGRLSTEAKLLLDDFKKNLKDYQQESFVYPTLGIVGVLPIDELAEMAETLVNLTSFKRRMSMDAETVGGPIDVAVISKGDGFVWIRRKHYFKPDLNHGFFSNYYRNSQEIN